MRKYLFRPFHDLSDAIFPLRRIFGPAFKSKGYKNDFISKSYDMLEKVDPHATFKQFFKENQLKDETQKEFFKKFFPQSATQKFDPYKVLEIGKDATIDQAKEAYRKLAIKYHPKNNTSPEAQAKFTDIAKAYQTILQNHNAKNFDLLGFRSFFQDFQKEVESIFDPKAEVQTKSGKEGEKGQKEKKDFGQLYSESTSYQTEDGRTTKFTAQKLYKKNGKLLKVTRQERLKDDGNVQITETIDNGQEVKRKNYTQERGKKVIPPK